MRVLWLSPWMRPLARVHAEALRGIGAEVLLVTTAQHPESDAARDYEVVLDPRVRDLGSWPGFGAALRAARDFRPDVVVDELVRDPRWLAFGRLAPRVHLVHDDRPHDPGEQRPRWERALFDSWGSRASATVAFSRYVADAVAATAGVAVDVVPLTSDLDPCRVPEVVPAADRRGVVLLGRLGPYKNLDVVFAAWERHAGGPGWRGDELLLVGAGSIVQQLPSHARWLTCGYRYADVLPVLSRAKASIVHYRHATQSGVQVLAMQLGVTPVVSPCGALPEFQPAGERAVGVDDVAGLARVLDALADPAEAHRRGVVAAGHYRRSYAAPHAAAALGEIFERVVAGEGSAPGAGGDLTPHHAQPPVPPVQVARRHPRPGADGEPQA